MKNMTAGAYFLVMLFMCPPHELDAQVTGWTATGSMVSARHSHTATLLNSGKVLIQGYYPNTGELYDPVSGTFDTTGSTVQNHLQGSTATLLSDGTVLIVGGINAQRVAEIYNPVSGLFSLTDSLTAPHSLHTATLLPNGTVLIAGGQDHDAGPQTHSVAEIYDPVLGSFTVTDSLIQHRSGHTATLLPNGHVLIAGGMRTTQPGSGEALASCEVYDPSTGSFSQIPSMGQERLGHTATLLQNGLVLIAGGSGQNTAELYDSVTQLWTPTANLSIPDRWSHSATLLPGGQVLLAGGINSTATNSAELYDPGTNTFSTTDSMITPRQQHTATLLADSTVLVAGGYDGSANTRFAELFASNPATYIREANNPGIPSGFVLSQNYPNPFNPSTNIKFDLTKPENIKIEVFHLLGQKVETLLDKSMPVGSHEVEFTAKNLPSGVYLYRIEVGDFQQAKKMILLK